MTLYFDDNFGEWDDMDDPAMVDFYFRVQGETVEKRCIQCGRIVLLCRGYDICNRCADMNEKGY